MATVKKSAVEKLRWYKNRLSLMSPAETFYRAEKVIEKKIMAFSSPRLKTYPALQSVATGWFFSSAERVLYQKTLPAKYGWTDNKAKDLKAHLFSFFSFQKKPVGSVIDWHADYKSGKRAPLRFSKSIDYRDYEKIGDIKYIWEHNRHHHLVTLAKAWYLTGDETYKTEVIAQLESWFKENPYMMGVNWESSLEAGIRLLVWAWVWFYLGDLPSAFKEAWIKSIYEHCVFIEKHFSRHSSANNHLIGEASGLFVGSIIWNFGTESVRWKKKSFQHLVKEIGEQTYADGVNKEQAVSYQQFVLDFFLLAGMVGEKNGSPMPASYWEKIEGMMVFLKAIMDRNGHVPQIGDADDGYAVILSDEEKFDPYRSLLATGAALFGRSDFKAKAGKMDEKSFWLFGAEGEARYDLLDSKRTESRKTFPDGGYYILSSAEDTAEEVKIVADCGPLGYLSLAAHGHADALSFTLSAGGQPVLVDPGTYAYHTQKDWRNYFKGTSAHNTVTVDDLDQSVSGGNFMWLQKARSSVLKWESNDKFDFLAGSHDGYSRLKDPVEHQRSWLFDKQKRVLKITDKFTMSLRHRLTQYFHLAPGMKLTRVSPEPIWEISGAGLKINVKLDASGASSAVRGSLKPVLGWFSNRFDVKEPSEVLVNVIEPHAPCEIQTIITLN